MGRWEEVSVDGSHMRCYLAEPQAPHGAGVLVCMHGPGVDDFIQNICERFASRGFVAIAPDFYHRQCEPHVEPWTKVSDGDALRDMAQAVRALTAIFGVNGDRVGVVGFCMGGRLAFLYAASAPALGVAVVFHCGDLLVARDGLISPLDQARHIRAPLLGLFGSEDENPSPTDVREIDTELTRLGKVHEFESYAGAGHAFLNFTRPAVFRQAQATAAWAKCLAWLEKYLEVADQSRSNPILPEQTHN